MHKETWELVRMSRSNDVHEDTETGSALEGHTPSRSGSPCSMAIIATACVVALSLGIVGTVIISGIGRGSAPESIEMVAPISKEINVDLPRGKTTNRSRMGCSNWKSIALKPALEGHTRESCAKTCSDTNGCYYANFQVSKCKEGEGVAPGACYLLGPGCHLKENHCWDLNVAPGPPAFKLEKPRTGCSNWMDISIKEHMQVENVFQCSVECAAVNCSTFVFAPGNKSCHVLKDTCVEVQNTEHDLYRAIPAVSGYTWTSEYIEAPHHHVVADDVGGYVKGTKFTMLYPRMHSEEVTVVQQFVKTKSIMFAPALNDVAFEGTLLYTVGPTRTSLTGPVGSGTTVLPIASKEGFSVGQTITIIGGGNQEWKKIVSFASVVIDTPLQHDYPAGSLITASPEGAPTAAPTAPTAAPTAAPTRACWPAGTEVRIKLGSKYDDGATGGSCATIGASLCEGDAAQDLTFGNSFTDPYEHSDVEPFTCPTAAPTTAPTAEPTQAFSEFKRNYACVAHSTIQTNNNFGVKECGEAARSKSATKYSVCALHKTCNICETILQTVEDHDCMVFEVNGL